LVKLVEVSTQAPPHLVKLPQPPVEQPLGVHS
jgi:hypothetical protein